MNPFLVALFVLLAVAGALVLAWIVFFVFKLARASSQAPAVIVDEKGRVRVKNGNRDPWGERPGPGLRLSLHPRTLRLVLAITALAAAVAVFVVLGRTRYGLVVLLVLGLVFLVVWVAWIMARGAGRLK